MEILLPNVTPADTVARRFHQMFPELAKADLTRIDRFGTRHRYPRGTRLFAAGKPGPGMFVMLEGVVTISQRDGLGHVVPIVRQGPRPSSWPRSDSSRAGRRWSTALPSGDVEAMVLLPGQLRALIIAEADLGERIVRALILRRVALIEAGVGGPVLIGHPGPPTWRGCRTS